MDRGDGDAQWSGHGVREPLSRGASPLQTDIQSPGDAKRYFCFFNTPGSAPFRQLVAELQKPIDKGKYKYEDYDTATGQRSYCGVPIPADALPRPNEQAVWCDGKWVY